MMRAALLAWALVPFLLSAQVVPTGSMRSTMWEGQLGGLISMDSIARPGMYGIGPLAFLTGEITLVDGRCFVSRVTGDSAVVVEERRDVQAPFFVRVDAATWTLVPLPDHVVDLRSLDALLTHWAKDRKHPFLFRLRGLVGQEIGFHVMNVPAGVIIHSPEEAHMHQVKYMDRGNEGTLIGFFSTQHHGIFVHHDANIHVHYLSWDHTRMGHVDHLRVDPWLVVLEIADRSPLK